MELSSPAKINLFLKITGRRPDGYHDLFTLMCPVGVCDTVSLTFGSQRTRVSCADPDVPEDGTNLAHRAATLFLKALGKDEGVEISIRKTIPVAAGLGGGSSNAATVLSGLNRHYDAPFSHEELMDLGRSLGADVPFFIFGKPAIATGIGEKLEAYQRLNPFKVLLIFPGFSVSTKDVYKKFDFGLTSGEKEFINMKSKDQIKGFKPEHLFNDLETVTASEYPDIIRIKKLLSDHGADGSLMSGSGPTVFGIFSDVVRAEHAKRTLSRHDRWRVHLAEMLI